MTADPGPLLEIGRIAEAPRAAAGEVAGDADHHRDVARLDPGFGACTPRDRRAWSCVARRAATSHRWIVTFAGVDTREQAEALAGVVLSAAPKAEADDGDPRRAVGPRAGRARRWSTPTGVERGPVVAVVANPASDLLELASGALVPLRFVVGGVDRPERVAIGAGRLRPTGSSTSRAHRRLHHLPRPGRRVRRRQPARPGPPRPGCSTCACTTCARATPDPHRSVDDSPVRRRRRHGADARAGVRGGRAGRRRPGRCCCSAPAAAASTRPAPASWPSSSGFSLLCGRYEGVDERVRTPPGRRRAVRSATTCWPAARWRPWPCSRPWAGSCPGSWATTRRPTTSPSPTACSSTRTTREPAELPGLDGAGGAALRRPRPGRALAAGPGAAAHPRGAVPT